MNLSVVIPSRTASNLVSCVQAVRKHDPTARIIVVDDGVEWAFAELDGVYPVKGVKPFVFARNCNLGIAAAGSDDVVLLNDDAILESPGGFSLLQRAARERPDIGVIGAACNNVGNPNQRPRGVGLRAESRMVCFVCVLIPRSTIDRVGLLDEEFVGYGFDDDSYCLRARRAGLKIAVHDGCYVDHGSLRSTYRGDPSAPASLEQNAAIFCRKYGADNRSL